MTKPRKLQLSEKEWNARLKKLDKQYGVITLVTVPDINKDLAWSMREVIQAIREDGPIYVYKDKPRLPGYRKGETRVIFSRRPIEDLSAYRAVLDAEIEELL